MLAHIAVAVADLSQSAAVYSALGFTSEPIEVVEHEHVRLQKWTHSGVCFELIEAFPAGAGNVAKFIAKRGPGLHHVALQSQDILSDLQRLNDSGIRTLPGYPAQGSTGSHVAFLDPHTTGGVLIELVERH